MHIGPSIVLEGSRAREGIWLWVKGQETLLLGEWLRSWAARPAARTRFIPSRATSSFA